MQTIKKFMHGDRRKYFVAIALSLLMSITTGNASYYSGNISAGLSHPTIDWVLDKTVADVEFYHAITTCNDKTVVFLKFVNNNGKSVKISWKEIFVTKTNEQKEGFGGKKELTIAPGTTTPADCTDTSTRLAIISSTDVDPTAIVEILNFIYKDITVDNL